MVAAALLPAWRLLHFSTSIVVVATLVRFALWSSSLSSSSSSDSGERRASSAADSAAVPPLDVTMWWAVFRRGDEAIDVVVDPSCIPAMWRLGVAAADALPWLLPGYRSWRVVAF